jgi:hypothetical protein
MGIINRKNTINEDAEASMQHLIFFGSKYRKNTINQRRYVTCFWTKL